MSRLAYGLLLLSCVALGASPQRRTVAISDMSESTQLHSALPLSGEVTLDETSISETETAYEYHEHIVGSNRSGKTIVGLVTVLDISGSAGALIRQQNLHDAFFGGPDEIAPGQRFVHTEHGDAPKMTMRRSGPNVEPLAPHAEARVLYLEFEDGTTIGDKQRPLVRSFLAHRAHLLEAFKRLDAAASTGEEAFLQQLAVKLEDPVADGVVESELREYQRTRGTASTIATIKDRLRIAATRKSN